MLLLIVVFHFSCTLPSHLMDTQWVSYSVLEYYIITLYCIMTCIINQTYCLHALLEAALKPG